jgi:acetoin utilization protein AcuA
MGYTGMGKNDSAQTLLTTARGDVRIRSFCSPAEIGQCTFDRQFASHDQYKSLYTSRELLENSAEQPGTNVVLALVEPNHIIGYGVLAYPDAGERWTELGSQIMMEVAAIEVCRSWRSLKLAPAILKALVAHPRIEEKIVYMVGYSWTWDLNGTGKTAPQYRQMLVKLFKPHGFMEYRTNEPNICLKPENLFMCRAGNKIDQVILDRFKWLRFGLSPWTWQIS